MHKASVPHNRATVNGGSDRDSFTCLDMDEGYLHPWFGCTWEQVFWLPRNEMLRLVFYCFFIAVIHFSYFAAELP